jgi:hypothetical protein
MIDFKKLELVCPEMVKEIQELHWLTAYIPEYPCPRCGGMGRRTYGSGSTWMGGIGGQVLTTDVCDACWGSGTSQYTGTNLKKMRSDFRALEHRAERAEAKLKKIQEKKGI